MKTPKPVAEFRFIDLFAGLGGFHLAATRLGGSCVFASEINPDLRALYASNFGFEPRGDIRKVDLVSIPKHDLLCAGFPCSPFSKAGNRLGLGDTNQGKLFLEIIKILRTHTPEFFILENIAHFVNHADGKTYSTLVNQLKQLNYDVRVAELSPHQFGIPQIRNRMYLIGRHNLKGSLSGFQFPIPDDNDDLSLRSILEVEPVDSRNLSQQVTECLETWQEFLEKFPADVRIPSPIWTMEFGATYPINEGSLHEISLARLREARGSFGVPLKKWQRKQILELVPSHARRHGEFPKWKQEFISRNRAFYLNNRKWLDGWLPKIRNFPSSYQKFEWHCGNFERDLWTHVIRFRASGVRVKLATTSPSLVAMSSVQIPIIGWERRYMTMRECARLQSMEGLKCLPETVSQTSRALGNAVNVEVVSRVLQNLLALREPAELRQHSLAA